jgi:hypothetical protein
VIRSLKTLQLEHLAASIRGFPNFSHADKIRIFAWYLHSDGMQDRFSAADIRKCYKTLSMEEPSGIHPFLNGMLSRTPKELLKDSRGYYLEKRLRDRLEAKYGQRAASIHVTKLLADLPARIPDLVEREFLNEALICFRHCAYRAAIVMCWNLTFDHLCRYVISNHLPAFNASWPTRYPKLHAKARISAINSMDDFAELKESEIIDICRTAGILSGDVVKILNQKLERRNSAAHPSNVSITQLQAEEFIHDLVTNVVVKLT